MFSSDLSLIRLDRQMYSRAMKVKLDSKVCEMIQELVLEMHLFKDFYLLPLGITVDGSK